MMICRKTIAALFGATLIPISVSLLPSRASADEICGPNAYIFDIEITDDEEIITCDCAPGYARAEGECREDAGAQLEALAEATLPAMSAHEYETTTGEAFKHGEALTATIESKDWSLKAKAAFQLGILMAERGAYEDAARFFRDALRERPDEVWIKEALDYVRGLQAQQIVRKQAGPIAQGVIDDETLGALPKAVRDRIVIATSHVDVGNFYAAGNLLDEALALAPYESHLRDAKVYVSQLVAQQRDRESTLSDAERAKKREQILITGQRDAAFGMGLFLLESSQSQAAKNYLREAQALYQPGVFAHRLLDELIRDAEDISGPSGTVIYRSKADAMLDALQYGKGDWERSIRFLEVASIAAYPHNQILSDALLEIKSMKSYAELTR